MKRYFTRWVVLLSFTLLVFGCSVDTFKSSTGQQTDLVSEQKFIEDRIKLFTKDEFRFVKSIKVEFINETVYFETSFAPEFGSIPIKNDIMRNVASHAVTLRRFFPEVYHFKYTVLDDSQDPRTALILTIDQNAIKSLPANYYGAEIEKNSGLKPDYRNVFSKIEETDIGRGWRFEITPGSNVP